MSECYLITIETIVRRVALCYQRRDWDCIRDDLLVLAKALDLQDLEDELEREEFAGAAP